MKKYLEVGKLKELGLSNWQVAKLVYPNENPRHASLKVHALWLYYQRRRAELSTTKNYLQEDDYELVSGVRDPSIEWDASYGPLGGAAPPNMSKTKFKILQKTGDGAAISDLEEILYEHLRMLMKDSPAFHVVFGAAKSINKRLGKKFGSKRVPRGVMYPKLMAYLAAVSSAAAIVTGHGFLVTDIMRYFASLVKNKRLFKVWYSRFLALVGELLVDSFISF